MKYLFYDLEYASTKGGLFKICEFGYVLTDETFSVLKRGNCIINPFIPRADWDWRVVKKILTRSVSEYEACPTFEKYYDDIKKMILTADFVFGHSLNGDAKALNQDCKRYGLPCIEYDFYDIKLFYKKISNTENDTSVANILESLGVEGEQQEHDAESDAYNTMLGLKQMLIKADCSLSELIAMTPEAGDKTENYLVRSLEIGNIKKEIKERERLLSDIGTNNIDKHGGNIRIYFQFLRNLRPRKGRRGVLNGRRVTISPNYEEHHFRQVLNLSRIVAEEGGTVFMNSDKSDLFVKYDVLLEDGTLKKDGKLNHVLESNREGGNTEITDFREFLSRLSLTEEKLDEMPMPAIDFEIENFDIQKTKEELAELKELLTREWTGRPEENGNRPVSPTDAPHPTIGDLFGNVLSSLVENESEE